MLAFSNLEQWNDQSPIVLKAVWPKAETQSHMSMTKLGIDTRLLPSCSPTKDHSTLDHLAEKVSWTITHRALIQHLETWSSACHKAPCGTPLVSWEAWGTPPVWLPPQSVSAPSSLSSMTTQTLVHNDQGSAGWPSCTELPYLHVYDKQTWKAYHKAGAGTTWLSLALMYAHWIS